MKTSILTGYLNSISPEDFGGLKIHYSFDSVSGQVVFNNLFTKQEQIIEGSPPSLKAEKYPAVCPSLSSANIVGNSGFFQGNDYLQISSDIKENEWSLIINYSGNNNATGNLSEILLSSVDSSGFNSGFILGINNCNRLFFEFAKENSERETFTFIQPLRQANSISISKTDNNVNLSIFDFSNQKNLSQDFIISGYENNIRWAVGNTLYPIDNYTGFSGRIFDFIYFNNPINKTILQEVCNMSFCSGYQPQQIIESGYQQPKITGVVINPTGILTQTGIIGNETLFDYSINGVNIYKNQNITGVITGQITTYLTGGEKTAYQLVMIPENLFYDYNFASSFTDDSILFLKPISPASKYEIYIENERTQSIGITSALNLGKMIYDYKNVTRPLLGDVSKRIVSKANVWGSEIFFGLEKSGFFFDGKYDPLVSRNFYINGSGIYGHGVEHSGLTSAGFVFLENQIPLPKKSELIFDITSGSASFLAYTGQSSFVNSNFSGKDIYWKNKKLISGINYTQQSDTTEIQEIPNYLTPDIIVCMPKAGSSSLRYTGYANQTITLNSGIIDGERVWLDGLRQIEGADYIKISSINLSKSNNFIPSFSDVIYNNNKNFFTP